MSAERNTLDESECVVCCIVIPEVIVSGDNEQTSGPEIANFGGNLVGFSGIWRKRFDH